MKTIIEMAREAGLIVDANQSGFDSVEALEALVRADERERLIAGVEMPEPWVLRDGQTVETGLFTADQLREFAAAAVARDREECAKLFELTHKDSTVPPVHFSLSDTAKIIRARGKA